MPETDVIAFSPRPPVVLCILDGWGERALSQDNAIALADTPNWDRLLATCPRARLDASAGEVGLPEGQMGNSEVGHMNIGAGRIVVQDLPRIDAALADGTLAANPVLGALSGKLRAGGGTCHLMGLMSPGGVHSHQDHMVALARILAAAGTPVAVHAFLDGRDTPPASAAGHMERFLADLGDLDGVAVATVGGRYWAMDRDRRWPRVAKAYAALIDGQGETAPDPGSAVERSYASGANDEFVLPTVIGGYAGMKDGDAVLMANFRADRVRQILTALADPDFDAFERRRRVDFAAKAGMTEYSPTLNRFLATLFQHLELDNILGQIVSEAGMTQLRIAEREMYAHV